MPNFIRRFRDRFALWRAARNQDPDLMLRGIHNEFERLFVFLDSAAPDVACYMRDHLEFDREKHHVRYTGGPVTIRLRREE
jgi:hypothetical protein